MATPSPSYRPRPLRFQSPDTLIMQLADHLYPNHNIVLPFSQTVWPRSRSMKALQETASWPSRFTCGPERSQPHRPPSVLSLFGLFWSPPSGNIVPLHREADDACYKMTAIQCGMSPLLIFSEHSSTSVFMTTDNQDHRILPSCLSLRIIS